MNAGISNEKMTELLGPFIEGAPLSPGQLASVQAYLDLLRKWNAKINLTAIRDPEKAITRHFGESLFVGRQLFPDAPAVSHAIDVGSGAGFPGLPIKIWNPSLRLTLIESNHRKATFLREVVRALALSDVEVTTSRAEDISAHAELVTFRAVENYEQVLRTAQRLVAPGGRLAMLIGDAQGRVAQSALSSARWQDPKPVPLSNQRVLLIGRYK